MQKKRKCLNEEEHEAAKVDDVGKEAKEGDQTMKRMSPAEKMVKNKKKHQKKIINFISGKV